MTAKTDMPISEKRLSSTLLIVDDEPVNLHVLNTILQADYRLLFATNGAKAIELARDQKPDLILLDVMLPEMNGYEICHALKENAQTAKIPVIFVSAMSDVIDESLGFEAGGVDYIAKPVNPAIVRARVSTHLSLLQELQNMQLAEKQLRATNAELERYKNFSEYELSMARELMEHMIQRSSAPLKDVEIWLQAATNLCGDVIITQNYCNDRSYVLLADAMGHGLPAALPLMPIVQTFSPMAKKGFTLSAIIRKMNEQIIDFLPAGNFVAVTLLSVDYKNQLLEIWNGGNPSARAYNSNGDTIQIFPSRNNALGMSRKKDLDSATEVFHWDQDCWLSLFSDGLTEAINAKGEFFEEYLITSSLCGLQPHQSLKNAVLAHLDGHDAHDDISIATILLANSNL